VHPLRRFLRLVWGADIDRPLYPVVATHLVGSAGGSCLWSFVGIWAIKKLGADPSALGLAFLLSAGLGVASGYIGGHISDYVGRKPLILIAWTGQTLIVLAFLAVGGNELAGLGVLAFGGIFFQLGNAADTALVADLVPAERHESAYAAVRVASNLGITCGPPLGGLFLAVGGWSTLFVGAASITVAGLVIAAVFLPSRGAFAPEEPPSRGSFGVIVRDRPFLLFLLSAAFAWLVYVAFETVLPISLVASHGYAPSTWGFLLIVNPALVTFFQLRLTERLRGVSPAMKLGLGLPLMGLPFLFLPLNDSVPAVLGILFVFVLGEMLWVPTSQTIVAGLAPADIRGAYMGAFGATGAIGFALAPLVGLQVRKSFGDTAVWELVAALSLLAAVLGVVACRNALDPRRAGETAAGAASTLAP
jgi:predicted MFS family arabinose efflux permease